MTILAERIIAILIADSTLTTLLGSVNNIFPENMPLRPEKYVTVSTGVGEDQNNIPADIGEINITAVTSRRIEDAGDICLQIAERLDTLLNKTENNLYTSSFKVLSMVRGNGTDLMIDSEANEYWVTLTYDYILSETS